MRCEPQPTTRQLRVVGHGVITVELLDPRGLVGRTIEMPNSAWPEFEDDEGTSTSVVAGYAPALESRRARAAETYVVTTDGVHYAFSATATANAAEATA